MTEGRAESNEATELRQRAAARLEREVIDIPDMSPGEVRKLVHELRTHQIELEMQNEELRATQDELVESRDRYSDLYDFAPVGYVTVSHNGLILEANLTVAGLLGVERGALVKQPFSAFIVPDDQDIYYRCRRTILESKQRDTCRVRMLRRDAEPIGAELDSILIEADDEGGSRMRTVISDITERQLAEEERRTLERRLQQAQKLESLAVLAGGMAHDFNNLLTAILGNVNLALEELSPMSSARGNLREIETASKRAAVLANQMLAYSGRGRFVSEPIDIGELLEEMAPLLEASIPRNAVLTYSFAESLPTFDGDVAGIRQVIVNLITNAAEAIGDKSGVIALSTGTTDCDRAYLDDVNEALRASLDEPLPAGVYTHLEVADTGSGMDAGTIEKTFDPFFTTKFTGRGLGMSAVLGILRGHKGTLKIHSEVGKGTTFKVLFPANNSPGKESVVREKSEAEGSDWRGSGTVLIAEDEEGVCAVGQRMLERLGFRVLTAPNGHEALKVLREHPEIECVLLDLTMPHMDGAEAFREMQRLHPGVKVIICSGYSEQDVVPCFAGKGLAGFIQKPFSMASLTAEFMRILDDATTRPVASTDQAGCRGHGAEVADR